MTQTRQVPRSAFIRAAASPPGVRLTVCISHGAGLSACFLETSSMNCLSCPSVLSSQDPPSRPSFLCLPHQFARDVSGLDMESVVEHHKVCGRTRGGEKREWSHPNPTVESLQLSLGGKLRPRSIIWTGREGGRKSINLAQLGTSDPCNPHMA